MKGSTNKNTKPWLDSYDRKVPAGLEYPAHPLHMFLEKAAEKFPDRACTVIFDTPISFAEMNAAVSQIAGGLIERGLKKGDRVGILLPNCPEFLAAYFGILKAGGVVVAINPQYTAREIEFPIHDSGLEWMITLSTFYMLLKSIPLERPLRGIFLIAPGGTPANGSGFSHELSQQAREETGLDLDPEDDWLFDLASSGHKTFPTVVPEDPAIFQYSGGTTGTPKAAIGLHRNLVANTLQFRHWMWNMEDGRENLLLAIPLFHVYGMVLGMNLGMALAATMVIVPNPRNMDELLGTIDRWKPTLFPSVPSLYNAIVRSPLAVSGQYSLQSLRVCISGSAPLSAETKGCFERLINGRLIEGYGLSEAPTATHCNPLEGANKTGSIGLPLPDVDCRIMDMEDSSREVGSGEIGELWLRGPQVMAGYHNLPEETRIALQDGWLATGDIVRMDEDGYFYVIDRKKELIKVNGLQVWPREIEDVLGAHPAVQEVGAAGIPDELRGEAVKAWVVLKPGCVASVAELQAWCRSSLARHKIPREIEFRDKLPRTTVGKVLRRELVRQHKEKA